MSPILSIAHVGCSAFLDTFRHGAMFCFSGSMSMIFRGLMNDAYIDINMLCQIYNLCACSRLRFLALPGMLFAGSKHTAPSGR